VIGDRIFPGGDLPGNWISFWLISRTAGSLQRAGKAIYSRDINGSRMAAEATQQRTVLLE
jgi:hypothetical protein